MEKAESLAAAVHKLEAILDPGLQREIPSCTAIDIDDTISEINVAEFGVLVQKLERLDHGDVPLLTRDEFGCFIWGPMKFLFEAAQTEDDEICDRLLDAYYKIRQGIVDLVDDEEEVDPLAQFTQLCDGSLNGMLDLHREALGLLRHSGLDALFRSELEQNHESLQEALEGETSDSRAPKRRRMTTESDNEIQEAYKQHKLAMSELKVKLQSPDYRRDHEGFTQRRVEFSSGTWIFSEAKFQFWYGSTDSTILCISGLPGMGMTTLMSTVANKIMAEKDLLRALLEQFMDQNEVLLSELVNKHLHAYADGVRETKVLQKLVKRAIETRRTTFLVLDGLDEYHHKEVDQTVEWLLATAKDLPDESSLRIIISYRRDSTNLHSRFDSYPSISLGNSAHTKDVRRYCGQCCTELQYKFGLMPEKREEIAERAAELSNGNFLYARVLLGHVLSYPAAGNPGTRLWPSISPEAMTGVYHLIMSRLHRSKDGIRLLGLLLVAERPLRWQEAQALLCINTEKSTIDKSARGRYIHAAELCRGVVDLYRVADDYSHSEELIRILHADIKKSAPVERTRHNQHSPRACQAIPILFRILDEDIEYFEPLDYTVQHWYHHAKATVEAYVEGFHHPEYEGAIASLETFLRVYMRESCSNAYKKTRVSATSSSDSKAELVSFEDRLRTYTGARNALKRENADLDSFSSAQNHGAPSSLEVLEASMSEIYTWSVTGDPFTAPFKIVLRMNSDLNICKNCTVTTGGHTSLHSY
ncbi:hypothetical protein BHE90_011690 [Fusarium euwallaceae]|uniref:Nephrocystin 3-like N-terminal domain-containing protein n=1 Tax=Fusarium euwallaceae TaxID=1147111 RepID=A0A430LDU6_9HYPO|nr:hypothetical protein BHE90_011690 [Fusarium euwallaceae]